MNKKVIREFQGKFYLLKDTRLELVGIEKYKNTYWLECDKDGNIVENPTNKTILCKIPMGYDDIDIASLKEDCLYKN